MATFENLDQICNWFILGCCDNVHEVHLLVWNEVY